MNKVADNNTRHSRIYSSALLGLAVTLAMSMGASANADKVALLQLPDIERSSNNIDLDALETKISNTQAIGFFAKLRIRIEIDSLTDKISQILNGRSTASLKDVKRRYEDFHRSTVTRLRKGAPSLADELAKSRDQFWMVLTKPKAD